MPKKADHQTDRSTIEHFQQIINIGPKMAEDFHRLGLKKPQDLIGKDPVKLYQRICKIDSLFHDPCVLDCYIASIDYMNGNLPRVWWEYTEERKSNFTEAVDRLRGKYAR